MTSSTTGTQRQHAPHPDPASARNGDLVETTTSKPGALAAATSKPSPSRPEASGPEASKSEAPGTPTKLDTLAALLTRADGASIAELTAATGWQQHSVRGAMAGSLKKRGLVIVSDKSDGTRRYRATSAV